VLDVRECRDVDPETRQVEDLAMSIEPAWDYQTREVTDLTEDEILREVGEEGWELLDLGPLSLHLRRPRDPALHVQWEYARQSGTLAAHARQQLLDDGWQPTAHSAVSHYFKRPRGFRSRPADQLPAGEIGLIAAQFALYPLRGTHLTPILDAAVAAARATGASVEPGHMSSILQGTQDQVFAALQAAFAVAAASGETVLVVTVSNGCPVG
jgi:hypothetical protein